MNKKNTFLWGSPRVFCVKKVQVSTPPLLGLPTQTSARVDISIRFATVSISNGRSFFSNVSFICDWRRRTTGMKGCRPQGFCLFVCSWTYLPIRSDGTAWKSPNLPLFVPLLLTPPTFSLSAHCWPQSHQTLGVLADAEAPVRGRPDHLQPGTGRGGPLVGRAGAEPESGESSPPSPPSPLPSTPRQGQREEAEVPGPSDHCAAVQHCWWVRTEPTRGDCRVTPQSPFMLRIYWTLSLLFASSCKNVQFQCMTGALCQGDAAEWWLKNHNKVWRGISEAWAPFVTSQGDIFPGLCVF